MSEGTADRARRAAAELARWGCEVTVNTEQRGDGTPEFSLKIDQYTMLLLLESLADRLRSEHEEVFGETHGKEPESRH